MGSHDAPCRGGDDCNDGKHLCKIVKKDGDFARVREIVRDARFYCRKCGRAANREEHLCSPERI